MKTFLMALVFVFYCQTSLLSVSALQQTLPIKRKCPDLMCTEVFCEYGTEPTVLADGCPGCPRCLPNPEPMTACPDLMCTDVHCEYGSETVLENGCPSCPRCLPNPKPISCPKYMCLDVYCVCGSEPTFYNGCPGCPRCLECPTS